MTENLLLPYGSEELGGLPGAVRVTVWDGDGEPPSQEVLDEVTFFCLPYMRHAKAVPLLSRMPALRTVQTLTAGMDDVLPHLPPGVQACNARGLHDASTAELGVTLILSALRGIPRFVRLQDQHRWSQEFQESLADKQVLIVGYGSIGTALEDRLRAFECTVARVARGAREGAHGPVHALDALPSLLPEADVVVLLTPLTEQTRHLVNKDFLQAMRDGALLVNIARGGVVDTEALLSEVQSGRIRAALDVTDPEPLPAGHPLWEVPGVLITPHVGGPSSAFRPRALQLLRDQLMRLCAGEPLANVVAPGESA